ncbi:MAG: multicopper oxidase domain-containing protein [Acidobacteriota bacterium]
MNFRLATMSTAASFRAFTLHVLMLAWMLLLLGSGGALASTSELPAGSTQVENPAAAGVSFSSYASPREQMRGREALSRLEAGTVEWTASVEYVDGEIYNPETGRMDRVRLRSYQGQGVDPEVPFVPPTIVLRPGDTFRFNLENNLPADDPSCKKVESINTPHCFNNTNMHGHGLWVSPTGNSDNVLLMLPPGGRFTHEYNIPSDHPAGTFWYHPHMHGSTALQVSSGMGGALIIRGERLPTAEHAGDIDTLLRTPEGAPIGERLIMMSQIAYACGPRRADGSLDIKTDEAGNWICDEGDIGQVEGYNQFGLEEPEPNAAGIPQVMTRWVKSGRHTALNGRVVPTFTGVTAGEIERWRFLHAGVSGSISVSFRAATPGEGRGAAARPYTAGSTADRSAFVDGACGGPEVEQFSIALDGLTRSRIQHQPRANMHPGYRDDLLMVFPEPGLYCIVDNDAPAEEAIRLQEKSRELLGYVLVEGPADALGAKSPKQYVQDFLVDAARRHMPEPLRARIAGELASEEMGLASFVSHESLLDAEVDGTQTLGFDVILDTEPHQFVVGNLALEPGRLPKLVDASAYVAGRIDRQLTLEHIEEWTLASFKEGHPFHIHVNPFQIVSMIDPDTGIDVSAFGSGSVYAGLKGQWKDTVFVPTNLLGAPFVVKVRTQYRRYIGTFVLHCHILDHEDFGMMQALTIDLPKSDSGHGGH